MRWLWLLVALAAGCERGNLAVPDGGGAPPDGGAASDGATGDLAPGPPDLSPPPPLYAYVGGYAPQISRYRFDATTGALTTLGTTAASGNPSFLAFDPARRHLYAVDESNSKVQAFAIDATSGNLTHLGLDQPSGGSGPAHLSVDPSGAWVLVANYGNGTVATLRIQGDGSLAAPSTPVAAGMMAHEIVTDATGRFAFVPCLGSNDVAQYRFDAATGALSPSTPATVAAASGAGPRHLAFHPGGGFAYIINETASTLAAYTYDGAGHLATLQSNVSTLPPGFSGSNTAAELQLYGNGRWLYASNRGDDSIALFTVGSDGKLTATAWQKTGGKTPRHFSIDPTGRWILVADQDSNDVRVLRLGADGKLTAVGSPVTVTAPSFVAAVPLP